MLDTLDVDSLYTCIPHAEELDAIARTLSNKDSSLVVGDWESDFVHSKTNHFQSPFQNHAVVMVCSEIFLLFDDTEEEPMAFFNYLNSSTGFLKFSAGWLVNKLLLK